MGKLRHAVANKIEILGNDILRGKIDAAPMKAKKLTAPGGGPRTACDYCNYRGICSHDSLFGKK
ncbi:MAG: PD-(D/E)XK nuclease family protein [Clostridiales Family XIII bacterium]|nr:PD-(D/E)XK nuclease family protein [Clostridiales Family XIII bacterium]